MLGQLQHAGVGGGAGFYVDTDSKNSTRYLLHFTQSGSVCPTSRTTATSSTPRSWPPTRAHRGDVRAGVRRGRRRPRRGHGRTIVALETKLAAAHWDVVKRRDADLTYNLRTFADLPTEAPGFDWTGWLGELGTAGGRPPRSWSASPTS